MIDFEKIKKICRQNSVISASVVDDFLLNYVSKQNKLEDEAGRELAKYSHITHKQNPLWINGLKAQYKSHRIFKKDGLIKKYLHHSALKDLKQEERNYLEQQAETPWRFSFSEIVRKPEPDFYEMEDVFSEETFLLYSPGISQFLKGERRLLWFNLIGFNGYCWQSYGPINAYRSFEPEDIFFFASTLSPFVKSETDIINHIEQHPVPYMMLFSGSELPLIVKKDDQIVFMQAEYDAQSFAGIKPGNQFEIKYAKNVWQYGLKGWNDFPHFARFYYNEKKQIFLLASMTEMGFYKLVQALVLAGPDIQNDPDLRLNPTMLNTAERILKRKIVLDPYEGLFAKETSPAAQKELDKINEMIQLMLPDINAGKEPDVQALAGATGINIKTITQIADHLKKTRQSVKSM